MKVFFVEDDADFRAELADYLRIHGFNVEIFSDFASFEAALTGRPDALVLLDLSVDGQDGIDNLRDVVRPRALPCVVLSANVDEAHRVLALELGADDYILKTTNPREVLARLRAVARRTAQRHDDRWLFRPEQRTLLRPNGTAVMLTTAEFDLLNVLVENRGQPMSREALLERVFKRRFSPLDRAIDNLVVRLRAKLGDSAQAPTMIRTVRPIGYVFTGFEQPAQDAPARQ